MPLGTSRESVISHSTSHVVGLVRAFLPLKGNTEAENVEKWERGFRCGVRRMHVVLAHKLKKKADEMAKNENRFEGD